MKRSTARPRWRQRDRAYPSWLSAWPDELDVFGGIFGSLFKLVVVPAFVLLYYWVLGFGIRLPPGPIISAESNLLGWRLGTFVAASLRELGIRSRFAFHPSLPRLRYDCRYFDPSLV